MSIEEENKALIRHMYELMNRRELDALFKLFAPGYVSHYTDRDASLEQVKQLGPTFSTAFPDFSSTIEHLVAEGDKVAYREICRGTHQGEYEGIAPTGKKVEWINTGIMKITNGKVVEGWWTLDLLNLMQQLGVIPTQ